MRYTVHAINEGEREIFQTSIEKLAKEFYRLWLANPRMKFVGIQREKV